MNQRKHKQDVKKKASFIFNAVTLKKASFI